MVKQEDKKHIIIFGKNGQVGSSLIEAFAEEKNYSIEAFSSSEADFSNLKNLEKILNNFKKKTDFIINAAAYTNVDKAEEERDLADLINHKAVKIIAEFCAKNQIKLIHYSTDYVFDGSGNQPFTEDNQKNLQPLNYYGLTKLNGEKAIINSGCEYLILRTSWVWNETGKNFFNTIKRLAQEKEDLAIVSDQIGSPTNARDIALNTVKIIKSGIFISGIYHFTSQNYISWYDFALKIIADCKKQGLEIKTKEIKPIKSSEYQTKAIRPLNSRLNCDKVFKIFGVRF